MGLDQYLTRKVYVGANYEHRNVEAKISIQVGGRKLKIDPKKVTYIEERIGYWRKANAIHSWFVENVQGGEDDCNPHYVDKEQVEELLSICEKIIASTKLIPGKVWNGQTLKDGNWVDNWEEGMVMENSMIAEEFLPTQDGFFFGSTKYDEYYWQDILDTIEICKETLKNFDDDTEIYLYYQSSW